MRRRIRIAIALVLLCAMVGAATVIVRGVPGLGGKVTVTAYFDNSNGIFVGDDVRILGVPVGKIERIEPQPDRAKITFWYDADHRVPAGANAVILSPSLVTARAIQLTPAYTGGPQMSDNAVIPQDRTAVPVEWDEFREQLKRLTQTLQPTQPGGISTLGHFVNSSSANLRGQGPTIRDAVLELSQAMSALGDHSNDIFSTVKNLSILISALDSSAELLRRLNVNLAAATGLLVNRPTEISEAVTAINDVLDDVATFVTDNKETLGTTSDKVASVTGVLTDSLADIKQLLHVAPNTLQNYVNIYQPAQGTLSGALNVSNFANPITFLCGAVQAASRLNAEQSAKLCVQYLAPIIKNRQYNFLPFGANPFVGATVRPNEVTYSEDWLRPDYVPPHPSSSLEGSGPVGPAEHAGSAAPAPAEAAAGIAGMMAPPEGGGRS